MNEIRAFFRAVGSLWFTAVILVLLMIAMGSATVFEKMNGTEQALAEFYFAWWFRGLLVLGALNIFAATVVRFPWRPNQIGFLMTHAGLLIILVGALVTHRYGVNGRVSIGEGETVTSFTLPHDTLEILNKTDGTSATLDLQGSGLFKSGIGGFEPIEKPNVKRAKAGDDIVIRVLRYFPDTLRRDPASAGDAKAPSVELRTPARKNREPAILVQATVGDSAGETWITKYSRRSLDVGGKSFELTYATQRSPLGFAVRLNRFHIENYPGTMRPRSFESYITISDTKDGSTFDRKISMNHPTEHAGYTFYQNSYRKDARGGGPSTSILEVAHDPGQPIAFAGYFLTILGMFIVLAQRMRDPRRMGKLKAGVAAVVLVGIGGIGSANAQDAAPAAAESSATSDPRLPEGLDMSALRGIVVLHDGRWMPFETMARHTVWEVVGRDRFAGRDAITVLLSWNLDAERWKKTPVVVIGSAEARDVIGLPPDRHTFSFDELVAHRGLRKLFEAGRNRDRNKKPDPLESLVDKIHAKLVNLQEIYSGACIQLIPNPNREKAAWFSVEWLTGRGANVERVKPVRDAWTRLRSAFLAGSAAEFLEASNALAKAAESMSAKYRPPAALIETELRYNELAPFRWAWIIMAGGFGASLLGLIIRRKVWDALVALILVAGVGVGIYGLSLRGQLAGEIPATNMYESLLFLGLGVGAFAIVAMPVFRGRFIPLIACFLGALSLFLTDVLPLNYFVRPIVPVLRDTYWMTLHVPVIMVSYAVLFLGVLVAHVLVVTLALVPAKRDFIETLDRIHYWFIHVGSILLFIGIVTGSMWAGDSWGRYWGWDPKEVWSLVAFLGYMAIMHLRVNREPTPPWAYGVAALLGAGTLVLVVPKLWGAGDMVGVWFAGISVAALFFLLATGRAAVALKSILAFWLIIMTYIGVNYVLGVGLHSYGFGTGAVRQWAFAIGALDLGVVLACYLVHLVRQGVVGSPRADTT